MPCQCAATVPDTTRVSPGTFSSNRCEIQPWMGSTPSRTTRAFSGAGHLSSSTTPSRVALAASPSSVRRHPSTKRQKISMAWGAARQPRPELELRHSSRVDQSREKQRVGLGSADTREARPGGIKAGVDAVAHDYNNGRCDDRRPHLERKGEPSTEWDRCSRPPSARATFTPIESRTPEGTSVHSLRQLHHHRVAEKP